MTNEFAQLKQFFDSYNDFAVVCHKRPDADALGSLLAASSYLQFIGKQVERFCLDEIPASIAFLLSGEKIRHVLNKDFQQAPAVVLVDCGDLDMANLSPAQLAGKKVAVIDHHVTNPQYGEINVVEASASATAEIIFNYFQATNFAIDKKIATCLLAGIYGDTDGFSNLATTPSSLSAAAALLEQGANLAAITANLVGNKTVAVLKLWGRALERLKVDRGKGLATTFISQRDLAECQAQAEDTEGLANLFNHLADVKIALILREQADGTVRGSLRTTDPLIDVAEIAKMKGGGGHKKAAGFTVKGSVVEREQEWDIEEYK